MSLPSPDDQAWRDDAKCQGMDVEVFFADRGYASARTARKLCYDCPVRLECLSYAIVYTNSYDHGIYGGRTGTERRVLRRRLQALGYDVTKLPGRVLQALLERYTG